jgi:DHA1 family bicyclomycin/chloramphenicol resistance-like MFS transporter
MHRRKPSAAVRVAHPNSLLMTVTVIYILTASGLDIFNPALPEIQRTFGANVHDMSLILNSYFVSFSVMSVAMGVIGDRYDKRTIILACMLLFLTGSLLTLLPHLSALTAGRFLQGIGASGPVVLSLVVLLENHPPDRHAALVGKVSAVVAIATCVAPIVGASITTWAGWRGSFVLIFAIGLWVTLLVRNHMPSSPGDSSVRLSATSYVRLLRLDWLPGAFIVSLLRANYLAFLGFSAMYYVNKLGVSVVAMGFHLGTLALTFSLASLLSPRISQRFGEARCVRTCLWTTIAVASAMLAYVSSARAHPVVITAGMAVISALVVLPNNVIYPKVLSFVPDMRGRAAALVHAFKMIFSAILVYALALVYEHGITWIVAILSASYVACTFIFELSARTKLAAHTQATPASDGPITLPLQRNAETGNGRHS